jgi:hypothetical protein
MEKFYGKRKDIRVCKKAGFENIEYKGTWKDFKVYEPVYRDDKEIYWVGEAGFILEKSSN